MSDSRPPSPEDLLSDSELDSPKHAVRISRCTTWETGTAPPQEVAPASKAKDNLWNFIRDEVVPKGTYLYQELASADEIRILRILKGGREDQLECSLITSALASSKKTPSTSTANTLKYQALYYWWGEKVYKDIKINSYGRRGRGLAGLEQQKFWVRSNLEAALRRIRSQKRDIDIWVDAICINQNDKKEKTAQVSRMHEIYSEAENVCIWLGAGVPETSDTFRFLEEILDLKTLDDLIRTEKTPEKWLLIVKLMQNKWFSRRWVIQELTLAKSAIVRWGSEKLPWSMFADAIALFMTKQDEIKVILQKHTADSFGDARALGANTLVNATNNLFRKSEDGKIQRRFLTLEMLVSCHFLAFEATDPRDTIYAVLSIAKDTSFAESDLTARTSWMIKSRQHSSGYYSYWRSVFRQLFPEPVPPIVESVDDIRISPDYDKSLVDVCVDFMDYCIETSHSLDILCRHWAPIVPTLTTQERKRKKLKEKLKPSLKSEEVEKLPTWIPSIKGHAFGAPEDALQGRSNGDSFVGTVERQNQQHYNAAAGLLPWVKFEKCTVPQHSEIYNEAKAGGINTTDVSAMGSTKIERTLYIRGFQLGEITTLTGRASLGMIQHEAFEMCELKLDSESQKHPENVLTKVPDQLWRTLVADRGPNGINAPSWYHRACLVTLQHIDQSGDLHTNILKNTKKTPSTIISFLDRVQSVLWNRRFFQSVDEKRKDRKPLFGPAPPGAKMKDIICIIFGCSVPVLLRECSDANGPYFELVGECYVHGYMDGEAIHKEKRPRFPYLQAEEFNLR